MNPQRCGQIKDLHKALNEWENRLKEYETQFDSAVADDVKMAALQTMMPTELYTQRFKGKAYDKFKEMRQDLARYIADRAPQRIGGSSGHLDEMEDDGQKSQETSEDRLEKLTREVESLNAFVGNKRSKGDSKGKGDKGRGKGTWPPTSSPPGLSWSDKSKGKGEGKGEGKGKGDGKGPQHSKGYGKAGKRELVCYKCHGKGHPARLCPTLNELDEGDAERRGSENDWEEYLDFFTLTEDYTDEDAKVKKSGSTSTYDCEYIEKTPTRST